MAASTEKIKEIVGLYWLAGIPHEELSSKLSSPKMRAAVRTQYNTMDQRDALKLGATPLVAFMKRRGDGRHSCR